MVRLFPISDLHGNFVDVERHSKSSPFNMDVMQDIYGSTLHTGDRHAAARIQRLQGVAGGCGRRRRSDPWPLGVDLEPEGAGDIAIIRAYANQVGSPLAVCSAGSLHVTVSSWHNDTWHSLILKYVRFCAAFASLHIWHAECISCGEDKNEAAKAQESKKAV